MKSDPPWWVREMRTHKPLFDQASKVLEGLWHARGGGVVSQVLAGVTAVRAATDAVWPPPNPWGVMEAARLQPRGGAIANFLSDLLLRQPDGMLVTEQDDIKATIWRDDRGVAQVGLIHGGAHQLWLGPDGPSVLRTMLDGVWMQSAELQVVRHRGTDSVKLLPMSPPGPYIGGNPSPMALATRLRRYPPGPRTVLLRGPAGAGKTVLARRTSQELSTGARTLKLASSSLPHISESELMDLVDALQPRVLLLDDVDLSNPLALDRNLGLLEALRHPQCMVFLTTMTPEADAPAEELEFGAWHAPGMRPGRIDEVVALRLPNEEQRKAILVHYLLEALEAAGGTWGDELAGELASELGPETAGLSGAYLREVARRVVAHRGHSDWRQEVRAVRMAAPGPGARHPPHRSLDDGEVVCTPGGLMLGDLREDDRP